MNFIFAHKIILQPLYLEKSTEDQKGEDQNRPLILGQARIKTFLL